MKNNCFFYCRYIQGTENVGHLTESPKDLINLVVEQYKKIKSRIVLQVVTSHPDGITVDLESDCREQGNANRTCSNVQQATAVKFKAKINIRNEDLCGRDEMGKTKSVEIGLRGFTRDKLKVGST